MSHVKKQHFVPQFLLKTFLNENGLIWTYDKAWKNVKERGAGGVAYEEYFYDEEAGKKEGSYEYVLQRAETDAAPIIEKIISLKDLSWLAIEEKTIIGLFVALQLHRTKSALAETERSIKAYREPIDALAKHLDPGYQPEHLPARDLWFSSFENTPQFSAILLNKAWLLVESDKKFYLSDNPVVKQNIACKHKAPYRGVLGIDSEGIEIYFPLSPSLILGLCCEKTYYARFKGKEKGLIRRKRSIHPERSCPEGTIQEALPGDRDIVL